MSPFDKVLAAAQLMLLAMWEAIGILWFGWDWASILIVWFFGLWSLNIITATVVRTYFKLTSPQIKVTNIANIAVDEKEDIGG